MSNQADHTIVRLRVPPELKKQIEESAEKNNRSQSAEMVARLESSFEKENHINDAFMREMLLTFATDLFTSLKNQGVSREIVENSVNELKNEKAP